MSKKCAYCKDPILSFQKYVIVKGKRYHEGCHKIKLSGKSDTEFAKEDRIPPVMC